MDIDTKFDFWTELNPGRSVWEARGATDPDTTSKPLQSAHRFLWRKKLPNGAVFDLAPAQGTQLQWGKFRMSSDSISNSYMTNSKMRHIVEQVRDDAEELFRWGSRIGAFILFPAYRIERKNTINGARGMATRIADRIDLTLESIRRHYADEQSPLSEVLARYVDFFELFVNFEGYVKFWLLDDLVDDEFQVRFFLPFDNFRRNAAPANVPEYLQLKRGTVRFLRARTERIGMSCAD